MGTQTKVSKTRKEQLENIALKTIEKFPRNEPSGISDIKYFTSLFNRLFYRLEEGAFLYMLNFLHQQNYLRLVDYEESSNSKNPRPLYEVITTPKRLEELIIHA
mgnify:CR=1 FL=1